jgi:signal transduction histidine kinase
MSRWRRPPHLRTKLLLSYGLVIAIGVGGVALGVELVAPSLFDRHLGRMSGRRLGAGMSEAMHQETIDAFKSAMWQAILIAGALAVLAALAVSGFVTRRITAPVTRMVAASRRLAAGDYQTRVEITERDELGELASAMNEMAAELELAERRRVLLIGDVAHEVRTPLALLRGYLEGLMDGVVEPSPDLWTQLHGETTRLTRLIDDLQELSRVEAGRVSLNRRAIAPAALIETAGARLAPQFADKGVSLHVEPAADLPSVFADEERSLQVLTNLLTNALRYTPAHGDVFISATPERAAIRFVVRDTGIGIAAEHLPHVFDRFYRVDPSRSRALGGSGVGLTIAKALVEAQGGRIWVESPGAGQGATFSFTLPRTDRRS